MIAFQEVDGERAASRVFDPARYAFYVAAASGPARTGFAWKKGLPAETNPDFAELDVGGLRSGADITVMLGEKRLRLLSVHLKSGCFDAPLDGPSNACRKLLAQLPRLEAWIDARAVEGSAFAVLGDFNRRFFATPDEPFWKEIDDGEPEQADLWSPTEGVRARCWDAEYADFIDHLVLGRSAALHARPGSFAQHEYDASDRPSKKLLSDHCPISLVLDADPTRRAPAGSAAPSASANKLPAERAPGPIKGNISRDGRKLYHLPSCPHYDRVELNQPGERLFQTETEAIAAGWQKAGSCP